MISKLFRTRYKIEQRNDDWWWWISKREWWCPWWTEVEGHRSMKAAYGVAIREGWILE